MNLSALQKLVESGEGRYLEFKKKADHPEKIVREMVAFANSGGGVLLIGVEDNGRICGLKSPEEEHYVMEAALSRYARPEIPCSMMIIPVGSGRSVLKYHVSSGLQKPYYWLEKPDEQKYSVYVRSEDQSVRASYEVYRILRSQDGIRPVPVTLGDFEMQLFAVLKEEGRITISAFSNRLKMPRKKVSSKFIYLVQNGMLEVDARPGADNYRLSNAYLEGDSV